MSILHGARTMAIVGPWTMAFNDEQCWRCFTMPNDETNNVRTLWTCHRKKMCFNRQLSPFFHFHSKTHNIWHKNCVEESTIASSSRHAFPNVLVLLKVTTIAMLMENGVDKNPIMLKTFKFMKR